MSPIPASLTVTVSFAHKFFLSFVSVGWRSKLAFPSILFNKVAVLPLFVLLLGNSANVQRWKSYWKGWIPISAGMGLTILAVSQWKRWQSKLANPDECHISEFEIQCYRAVPLRAISRAWGWISSQRVPFSMREWLYTKYSVMFGVNLDEIADDLISFDSLSDFFIRQLREGVRPIAQAECLTSPADGTVLNFGRVTSCNIEQVKGVTYSIRTFLGEPTWQKRGSTTDSDSELLETKSKSIKASSLSTKASDSIVLTKHFSLNPFSWISWSSQTPEGTESNSSDVCHDPEWEEYRSKLLKDSVNNDLYQIVVYLAPGDYHRFHSPVNWNVSFRRHFQGELLSVNPVIAELVPELFCLNERAVYVGDWQHGFFSMTAVGATNVGSIRVYSDETLHTNTKKWKRGRFRDAELDLRWSKGDEVGEFRLGSTVVLLFEAPKSFQFSICRCQKIKVGESVCCDKEK
ncbi:unnamed protein product [Bemisia tabaci]|uniref:Phosphatidylserine decarboxylase proenzyme, mitochondrial n=1 Tax=Bemisia tabaci TaxID=7038 RepID=A0A9P0F3A1_BEMTA|nr:unnamed protein product [Bemisia tabaci]